MVGTFFGKLFKWILWITGLVTLVILLLVALIPGFGARWDREIQTRMPVSSELDTPSTTEPVAYVEEEAGIVELGKYKEITKNYDNPNENASVHVGSGEAVVGTADPGSITVSGITKDSEDFGFLFSIYNKSEDPIEVVFQTFWNGTPGNEHWNISPVLFEVVDQKALSEHVQDLQKTDQKPKIFYFVWDGVSLIPQN